MNKVWWGVLLNLRLIVQFYTVLEAKIDCQYHDTHDREWAMHAYMYVYKL